MIAFMAVLCRACKHPVSVHEKGRCDECRMWGGPCE